MTTALKALVLVGLAATTVVFTHTTVFDVNDPGRGLKNMHHELVVDP